MYDDNDAYYYVVKNEKYYAVRKKIYKDAAVRSFFIISIPLFLMLLLVYFFLRDTMLTVIAISLIVFMEIVTVVHSIGLIHKKLMDSDIDQLARKHPLFIAEDDTRVLMCNPLFYIDDPDIDISLELERKIQPYPADSMIVKASRHILSDVKNKYRKEKINSMIRIIDRPYEQDNRDFFRLS